MRCRFAKSGQAGRARCPRHAGSDTQGDRPGRCSGRARAALISSGHDVADHAVKSTARWQRSGPAFGKRLERHGDAALLSAVGVFRRPHRSRSRMADFFGSIGVQPPPGIRGDCGGARRAGGRARVSFVEPLTDSFSAAENLPSKQATPLVTFAVGLSLCYIADV